MKILVISPNNKTVYNFRGDLIKDMISSGHQVYVTGPNSDFIDEIKKLGVKDFFQIHVKNNKTSIKEDLRYFFNLRKLIQKLKPDLVFSYTLKPVVYGSIAAKSCGVKNIQSLIAGLGRIYSSESIKAKIVRAFTYVLCKIAFFCSTRVIFQNPDDVKDLVNKHYLPLKKTAVVNGSGVNMSRFSPTPFPSKPTFLMVCRIIEQKGVFDFAKASRLLKKEIPDARCILLGGFDTGIGSITQRDLQEFIDDGSIELPLEVKDPVPFYQNSSVFVLPSFYREGIPRSILEGMSCARPIITTNWPGCKEPIIDGVNGFLVPPHDPNSLYKRMLFLATHCDKAQEMGRIAYQSCKERFEVSIVNKQMKNIMKY